MRRPDRDVEGLAGRREIETVLKSEEGRRKLTGVRAYRWQGIKTFGSYTCDFYRTGFINIHYKAIKRCRDKTTKCWMV